MSGDFSTGVKEIAFQSLVKWTFSCTGTNLGFMQSLTTTFEGGEINEIFWQQNQLSLASATRLKGYAFDKRIMIYLFAFNNLSLLYEFHTIHFD